MERPIPKPRKTLSTTKDLLTPTTNGKNGYGTEPLAEPNRSSSLRRSNSTTAIRSSALRLRGTSKIATECKKNQERMKCSQPLTVIEKKKLSNIFNSDALFHSDSAAVNLNDDVTSNCDNNNNSDNARNKGIVVGIKSKFENLARTTTMPEKNSYEISKSFVISRDSPKSNFKLFGHDKQQNEKLGCLNENFAEIILKYFLHEHVFAKLQRKSIEGEIGVSDASFTQGSSPISCDNKNSLNHSRDAEGSIEAKETEKLCADSLSSAETSKVVTLLPVAKVDCWIPIRNNNNNTVDVDEDDSVTSKNISTSFCFVRNTSISASCKVRVLPRIHEMRSDFHCNEPDISVSQQKDGTNKSTTSWSPSKLHHNSVKSSSSPHTPSMIPILKSTVDKKKSSENNEEDVKDVPSNNYDELISGSDGDIVVSSCVALTLPYIAKESTHAQFSAVGKSEANDSDVLRKGVTLLERLVKTHPIWYLPHLGRTAAIHLLRPMPPGMFVVRGCSRNSALKLEQQKSLINSSRSSNNSHLTTMALSVRLPEGNSDKIPSLDAERPILRGDVDHYLIETMASGSGIRLEGSPFTFKSLPLLLQHYCINGDELQIKLRLPSSILKCDSIQNLQAIVLFGQEFWVNEVSRRKLLATAKHQQRQLDMEKHQQHHHIFFDNKPDQYGVIQNDQFHNDAQQSRRNEQKTNYLPMTNQSSLPTTVQQALAKPTKRTAPIVMHNPMVATTPNQQQAHCRCCNCVARGDYYKTSIFSQSPHSRPQLLPHSHRRDEHLNGSRSNLHGSQKGGSVWARNVNAAIPLKSKSSVPTDSNTNFSKARLPIDIGTDAENVREQSCWYVSPRTNTNKLSSGEYQEFSDVQKRQFGMLKKSQSAFEGFESEPSISSQSSLKSSRLKRAEKNDVGSVKGSSFLRSLFSTSNSNLVKTTNNNNIAKQQHENDDDYFLPLSSGTSTSGNNYYEMTDRENDASLRDNSMTRRAKTFARKILPFSNNNNGQTDNNNNNSSFKNKTGNSKDDSCRKLSDEAIRARQTAFKRRNTDLCPQSVYRLAGQLAPFENSPPPEFLQQNDKNSTAHRRNDQNDAKNQRQKIHQRILPIFRAGSSQENNLKSEEAQEQKRHHQNDLQHQPLVPPEGKMAMDQNSMQMCIEELRRKRMQSMESANKSDEIPIDPSQTGPTVVLRRNKLRASRNEKNRRSVPEATELVNELNCESECNNMSNREQDHSNQLANDGLVTPTLRRKHYQSQHDPSTANNIANMCNTAISNERFDDSILASNVQIPDNFNESTTHNNDNILNSHKTSPNLFGDHVINHADNFQEQMSVVKPQINKNNNALGNDEEKRNELLSENENHHQLASCSKNDGNSAYPTTPSITFRNSTRMSSFHSGPSAQSPLRQSKIAVATVRPQQHMVMNTSSSNESSNGASPPETTKNINHNNSLKKSSSQRNFKGSEAGNEEKTSKDWQSSMPVITTPPTSASSSAVFHTANNDDSRSPPSKRQSEYAHISELSHYFLEENPKDSNASKNVASFNNLEVPFTNEEDTVSVAGTDFNEPWDSNAWQNLEDLARFGDVKSTAVDAIKALHSTKTIVEEDDLSSPEELTLRAATHYGDYDDNMSSVVEEHFAYNYEDFDSLSRSQHGHPQHSQRNTYQLQQFLNIIPEKDFSPNSSDQIVSDSDHDSKLAKDTSAIIDLGSDSGGVSNLRIRRTDNSKSSNADDNGNIIDDKPAANDNQNVEMEATAMAAVLGSCGPRAICSEVGDGRISAVAKLAVSTPSSVSSSVVSPRNAKESPCSGEGTWRRQRNQTFRVEKDFENEPSYQQQHSGRKTREEATIEFTEDEDFINNNTNKIESGATRCVVPPQPPQRMKSSLSFINPFASLKLENSTGGGAKSTTMGGGGGDATSLGKNSYGRRRNGSEYGGGGGGSVRDTQSLHRMPNPLRADDLNSSLNNLTMQLPLLSPIISPPRFRNTSLESEPSYLIQRYVEQLAANEKTLFGATMHRFIECTVESEETDPHVVIRRVRQFLNGMKNYLMKNGELDLHPLIYRESDKLHANEFLNIDAIFETVLTKILLVPIKGHLYHLMVRENTRNGQLRRLSENLSLIRAMEPSELGFSPGTQMPDSAIMEQIRSYLRRMQNHYSPLKKLENLLKALSLAISRSVGNTAPMSEASGADVLRPGRSQSGDNMGTMDSRSTTTSSNAGGSTSHGGGVSTSKFTSLFGGALGTPGGRRNADTFFYQTKHQSLERLTTRVDANGDVSLGSIGKHLPGEELIRWLVYLLAKSSAINCEIEAWYIWELLPQQLLTTGEAAYYLSTLFSAVGVLKNPESIRRLKSASSQDAYLTGSLTTLQESAEEVSDAFLRIAVPNEHEGSIEYHTFPILPQMTVTKLCRVIAHQFAITNPEDYGLYLLFDGFETALLPKEYPQVIRDKLSEAGKLHLFAYRRNEARIAWPKNAATVGTPAEFQLRPL